MRPDGTLKVLDFGLAKANDPGRAAGAFANAPYNSPTFAAAERWFDELKRVR